MREMRTASAAIDRARGAARRVRRQIHGVQAERLWRLARRRHGDSFPLTDRPALVLAPHYDDETLGCGGMIARKRDAGAEVRVAFVTDGRRCFGPNVPDPDALEAMRQQEARDALAHLGVPPECVTYLGFPDGELSGLSAIARERAIARIGDAIAALPDDAEVFVPHARDRHSDHEAVCALTREALLRRGGGSAERTALIEYAVWYFWEAPLWGAAAAMSEEMEGAAWLDISEVAARKRAAIAAYGSQHTVLPPGFLEAHSRPVELFVRRQLERTPRPANDRRAPAARAAATSAL